MEPTKGTGDKDSGTIESTDTETNDATPDKSLGEPPASGAFRIPTVADLDAMRVAKGLSQRDLSRRAGCEQSRFNSILHNDIDPHVSTIRAFLTVLQEADARDAEEIERTGPKPRPSPNADPDPDDFELLSAQLDHSPPDAVGEDPRPPERDRDDGLRSDGGSKYHTQTGDGYVGTYTVRDTSCEVNAVTLGYERGEDIALVPKAYRTVTLTTDATTTEALKVSTVNEEGFLPVGKAVQHHLGAAVGDDLRLYDVEQGHLLVNADDDPFVATDGGEDLAAAGADRRPSGTGGDGGMLTGGQQDTHPTDLTQFQLNILAILAGDGTADDADYGLAIKRALEGYYGEEINHGRLYPNLGDLVERGLVVKDALDKRTNQYTFTDAGRGVLDARCNWLLDQTATTDDDPAPIAGEGGAAGGVE